ncbi:hypothetical protein ACN93_14455 [Gordonia paraffinivorans]|uniref:hypothetical protein n=1 Tax=Gordonia paraffinivorans TaxID=175628 RepID=UPI0003480395|nr:hypothetical protein [Gordonia paraffinivorans]MCD2146931.1 hypothetical protein [Gordonia paraffinivorans]PWD42339.1 hypothetical protein ACN93_14455 [Gordonia paraffinivorans]
MQTTAPDVQEMIDFAARWKPYCGAADDEIFTTFGVRPRDFYLRVAEALSSARNPLPHTGLRSYCLERARRHRADRL